jgi:hypothetical protein
LKACLIIHQTGLAENDERNFCTGKKIMSALDRIKKRDIRNLLGKGWLTHDGMWFYHTCREFGIERANALNRAAIHSLAPIEVERAKQALGISKEKFDTFDASRFSVQKRPLPVTFKRSYMLGLAERAVLRLQGNETDWDDR